MVRGRVPCPWMPPVSSGAKLLFGFLCSGASCLIIQHMKMPPLTSRACWDRTQSALRTALCSFTSVILVAFLLGSPFEPELVHPFVTSSLRRSQLLVVLALHSPIFWLAICRGPFARECLHWDLQRLRH